MASLPITKQCLQLWLMSSRTKVRTEIQHVSPELKFTAGREDGLFLKEKDLFFKT